MRSGVSIVLLVSLAAADALSAAEPKAIPIGKGSYAEFPPESAGAKVAETLQKQLYIVEPNDKPVPTNAWWTDLIISKYCGKLWAYPLTVSADEKGIDIFYPTTWNSEGRDMITEFPLKIGADGFKPADARAKSWSDWLISFRLAESPQKFMDVTLGHGLPFTWVECTGVAPVIDAGSGATFFDEKGAATAAPTGSRFGIEVGNRAFGVFAPEKTNWKKDGNKFAASFSGSKAYLVIAALPRKEDLAAFARYAYAIPRETQMDWSYDRAAGEVLTRWTIKTEPLEGIEKRTIQGWIPHHYRETRSELKFEEFTYATPRGLMKCTVGNEFTIRYPFTGILPTLPAPETAQGEHRFDPARMKEYLATAAAAEKYGEDTYWGGKDVTRPADYMMMAQQLKDPSAAKLQAHTQRVLADWFTYTPGETARYFARYPKWKALVGLKGSYGSEEFSDQHFHYGYYTRAAALLGFAAPEFLRDYGEMAKLVAKEYANWERNDAEFPFMRTFDIWSGHSWAGGYSSGGGNNQESTSEAMQSWGGLFLLGAATGDEKMLAAGAMGYAMESRATLEYWLNKHGDVLPPQYKHSMVGILFGGGNAYATYFSGDPAWIHGIQWLPISPVLNYLALDAAFARKEFERMMAEQKQHKGTDEISTLGGGLGNVVLGFQQLFDPDAVAAKLDQLWTSNDPIARTENTAALTYYYTHTNRTLGTPLADTHIALPASAVYRHAQSGKTAYVAYNPSARPELATVVQAGKPVGRILVPARTLVRETTLLPISNEGKLITADPRPNADKVPRTLTQISLVFDSNTDPSVLAGSTIAGPGVNGLRYKSGAGSPVLTLDIVGALQPAQTYSVTVPGKGQFAFKTEALAPLALVGSTPADGAERVPLDLRTIDLQFNNSINAQTLAFVRVRGAGVTGLTPVAADAAGLTRFQIAGRLQPDETYSITIPAQLRDTAGRPFPSDKVISFSAAPSPLPPVVYAESFCGGGHSADKSLTIDLRNREAPHSGTFAMKLSAGAADGTVYFFAGKTDNGEGRKGVDVSAYDQLEFWLKGTVPDAWIKVGHPVFDKGAFVQKHVQKISGEYQRFTIDLPPQRSDVGTLFVVSVPAGKTLYIDDVKYIKKAP